MNQYRWGIIGTGTICDKFCRALKTIERASISAICSRTTEKGEQFAALHGAKNVYTEIEAMCRSGEVDIVYIGNPHPFHIDAVIRVLECGLPVLCEKPFGVNREQVQRAADLAREKDLFLMEAMWTRFVPATLQVEKWIKEGRIGEVREVTASFHNDCPDEDPLSRLYAPELGGGALLDLGVYTIFASRFGIESRLEPEYCGVTMSSTGIDKEAMVTLRAKNGARAAMSFGFERKAGHAMFEGTDGYIDVPDWCFNHAAYLYKDGELVESFCRPDEQNMRFEAIEVMECLDKGLTESPRYTMSDALDSIRICDTIRERWGLRYPCEDEHNDMSEPATQTAASDDTGAGDMVQPGGSHMRMTAPDWYRDAVIYHIYPLGMCGAPEYNDLTSPPADRLKTISNMIGHIDSMGFTAVYFGPLFESSKHGYDTADYRMIDRRLGTNEQFARISTELHARGIKVIADGVFNHVGRDFWAFKDVQQNRAASSYCGWFNISFDGNSNYNDGFWYEGWEGHYDLVKLNLRNPEVKAHIFDSIRLWVEQLGIDGLRLDVAYLLDKDFLRELRGFCRQLRPDFFLLGEMIHGDYNTIVNDSMLDSCTNYECYKGLWSSITSGNMHEIGYSLFRQFGNEAWCLYRGKSLYSFLDNHDVSRIASIISDNSLLPVTYALMYAMPGIPSVYYGSELEIKGDKKQGDKSLRPMLTMDDVRGMRGALTEYIARLGAVRAQSAALCRGGYQQLYVRPKQLIFDRRLDDERVICIFNTDSEEHIAHFDAGAGRALDLISGQTIDFGGGLRIPAKTAYIARVY